MLHSGPSKYRKRWAGMWSTGGKKALEKEVMGRGEVGLALARP